MVICVLRRLREAILVLLVLGEIMDQALNGRLIEYFHLFVRPVVIRCCKPQIHLYGLAHGHEELRSELRSVFSLEIERNNIRVDPMGEDRLSYRSRLAVLQGDAAVQLLESISDHQNLVVLHVRP